MNRRGNGLREASATPRALRPGAELHPGRRAALHGIHRRLRVTPHVVQPAPRPCELEAEDGEADRDHHEGGTRQHQQGDPAQQHGPAHHRDHHAPGAESGYPAFLRAQGYDSADPWTDFVISGIGANLARAPKGNDREQARAIFEGKCDVALVTLAGRPRSEGSSGVAPRLVTANTPDVPWEMPYSPVIVNMYALAAARHMHEYGTTSEQLAWIKVAAAAHAQHNPNAMLREPVTVEEVLASPMISDPLHKLDCCVVSDGGGALVVVRPEIAARLKRPVVNILGAGETIKGQLGGHVDGEAQVERAALRGHRTGVIVGGQAPRHLRQQHGADRDPEVWCDADHAGVVAGQRHGA